MTGENDGKKVLVKYLFADDYAPAYANGAWGGMTPQGEICVHFFLDRAPLPNTEQYEVEGDSLKGPLVTAPAHPDMAAVAVRQIVAGITMSPKTARALVEFLQARLGEMEIAHLAKSGVTH